MELTQTDKIAIIKAKVKKYNADLYSLQLDYKVAEMLENEATKAEIEKATKATLRAVEFLERALNELQ